MPRNAKFQNETLKERSSDLWLTLDSPLPTLQLNGQILGPGVPFSLITRKVGLGMHMKVR